MQYREKQGHGKGLARVLQQRQIGIGSKFLPERGVIKLLHTTKPSHLLRFCGTLSEVPPCLEPRIVYESVEVFLTASVLLERLV